ncbi:MAG TPA: PKD domain-containing protein [Longimicrobiales bacterium]|nr:PKD domain-containing protein [Longimicrobiales bacterium]
MQHPRIAGAAKLVAVALVVSACADADSGVAPDVSGPEAAAVPAHAQGSPPDRAALARAVPTFGGIFIEDGAPTVYLTDTDARPAAERALSAWLAQEGYSPAQLQVRQGRFAYDDLQTWFEAASREVFAEAGVVLADLHESSNSVLIGVEDQGAAARVRATALRAGVPPEALRVEVMEPIRMLYSLRDSAPYIVGGLQINFPGYLCTLGFPAEKDGVMHFVTNSHCTAKQGGVDDTPYWQPLESTNPEQMGVEVADPTYSRDVPGCPNGKRCRYSDASLARAMGTRAFHLGEIADVPIGTGAPFQAIGELTITQAQHSRNCGLEGTVVHKTGRTTGHTSGTVTNACTTVGVLGSPIAQLEQVIVSGSNIIGSGDSGSPAWTPISGSNVRLEGIVWGGGSSSMVFSPLANVEQELGALNVVSGGTPPPPPPPSGPVAAFNYDCGNGDTCFFSAGASTGAAPLSYSWDFGDGATGGGVSTSHTYGGAGNFAVTLTVTENGGAQDTANATIVCNQRGPNLRCR